ncbi:MAG TPA: GlsB/YeaQ/YmgE family stress response membrane protein [Acidobacteriota bacterium]|jgi:uncharacterized membrane protein YeaQ/YmgE (transglycosylase-associated protein family)
MGFLAWILFGLIVGALAKLIMPGRDPGGCIITILLGIAGSFVGGFLGQFLGLYHDPLARPSWIMSILGAIVILALYRVIIGRRV